MLLPLPFASLCISFLLKSSSKIVTELFFIQVYKAAINYGPEEVLEQNFSACLIFEMFFIRDLKPKLKKQSDSIRAKLFAQHF